MCRLSISAVGSACRADVKRGLRYGCSCRSPATSERPHVSFYLVAGQSPATDPAPCGVHLPTRRPRRYPSDTTDVEWEIMAPYIPVGGTVPGRGGQPVTYPRRDIIDATLTRMHDGLRTQLRQALGRNAQPTATAADSQSVRAAETVARASRGYDAGKRVTAASGTSWSTPAACCWSCSSPAPACRTATPPGCCLGATDLLSRHRQGVVRRRPRRPTGRLDRSHPQAQRRDRPLTRQPDRLPRPPAPVGRRAHVLLDQPLPAHST